MSSPYHLIISGASIAGCFIAGALTRLGLRVLLLHKTLERPAWLAIEPVLHAPFAHFGAELPAWPFAWQQGELSGLALSDASSRQHFKACRGILLDYDKAVQGLLAQAEAAGTEVWRGEGIEVDIPGCQVRHGSEGAAWELMLRTEAPQAGPNAANGYYLARALIADLPGVPGLLEQIRVGDGNLLIIPIGQGQHKLMYTQPYPEDFAAGFRQALALRFPHCRFGVSQLQPRYFPAWAGQLPYEHPVISLGPAGCFLIGPWALPVELEVLAARFCLQQLLHYFADQRPRHLEHINDFAERLLTWSATLAKQANALWHSP